VEHGSSGEKAHENGALTVNGFGRQHGESGDVGAAREGYRPRPVAYLVLPNATDPFLLARVRWPDIYQAISPVRPDWQDDPGLFDLPYAPTSTAVTYDEAAEIAAEWGAKLPSETEIKPAGPSLIRRMPSDWSWLSSAERRAWSILDRKRTRIPIPVATPANQPASQEGPAAAPVAGPSKPRWWARRKVQPVMSSTLHGDPISNGSGGPLVIDLTDSANGNRATVELA
jgi:hypothetical protein